MIGSMLLAVAIASTGQYPSASAQSATPMYTMAAPTATYAGQTVLISAPPFWDRCLARTGAWLSSRAALHAHPRAAELYAEPSRMAAVYAPVTYAATPMAPMASMQRPMASGQGPMFRADAEAAPAPPMQYSPSPPTPSPGQAANLTPEQRLAEIRRLLAQ